MVHRFACFQSMIHDPRTTATINDASQTRARNFPTHPINEAPDFRQERPHIAMGLRQGAARKSPPTPIIEEWENPEALRANLSLGSCHGSARRTVRPNPPQRNAGSVGLDRSGEHQHHHPRVGHRGCLVRRSPVSALNTMIGESDITTPVIGSQGQDLLQRSSGCLILGWTLGERGLHPRS